MVTTRSNGRVAVVIPVSDPALLAESLDSVFLQSRPPEDVVVVADEGIDAELLRRAVTPYAGAVLLLREPTRCPAAVRNAGVAVSDAEFIAVLRCGDRWLPHFLMSQLHVLRQDAAIDLSFTNGLFTGDSSMAGSFVLPTLAGAMTLDALLAHGRMLSCSAVVARRSAVQAAGGFDAAARHALDFDLWLRMASRRIRFHGIAKPLILCRWSPGLADDADALESACQTLDRLLGVRQGDVERPLIQRAAAALRARAARQRGRLLLRDGDVRGARAAFAVACDGPHGRWQARAVYLALTIAPWLVRRYCETPVRPMPPAGPLTVSASAARF